MLDDKKMQRYLRQITLSEIGVKGQEKLLSSKVLVVGAGGLGSPVIMYLAAAGVGTIGIVDYDAVDMSNLHRQIIHRTENVNINKAVSASKAALGINPEINIRVYDELMIPENALEIISEYDFVADCTDRFETKFLINDACVIAGKPFSHAGIVRFEGQAMTYVPKKGPCLRCLMGEVPHNAETCREVGVMGAAVGVLGSIQALEAVKYLTGIGELLTGRILSFNGLSMNIRVHSIPSADEHCAVCGKDAVINNLSANRQDYNIID